ncbi:MarR family winged helix-turn-helix transcriptional regulator [Comamonas sp. JUb58]|uniref:MarR family winged helix-turn-helix transcriptional regulator n=1 Tax=Comamonas sp. JUb58 TaxID=2485114 RepID=UPI00105C10C5|nr:MarR family winged helix-turn-helix transcriptional regulator [Comamonas sp. JUb58]TDS72828.1 DNA-binding MarR family transcriptional regulator [Comamonas sp. JUb58]
MTDSHQEKTASAGEDQEALAGGFPEIEAIRPVDFPCWLMRIISTVVRAEVDRRMEPLGLTQAQWIPVLHLASGKAHTSADLARRTLQTPGAMTRLVDRLVDKGIIERERSTDDRRVVSLRLTDEGLAAAMQVPDIVKGVNSAALSPLSPDELTQFHGYLRRIYEAMPNTLSVDMCLPQDGCASEATDNSDNSDNSDNTAHQPGKERAL